MSLDKVLLQDVRE
ncbi:Protein of unknown function [Bacillus cereus]|nr:Protein of unknown function [Bacillus cereus]